MAPNSLKSFLKSKLILAKIQWVFLINPVEKRIIYLMGHGKRFPNLGDQAQSAAIMLWFKRWFDRKVVSITLEELNSAKIKIEKYVKRNDMVFLHSGGNFGDDWYETQKIREDILAKLSENIVIQLPQTVHFSNTPLGRERLDKTKHVLAKCRKYLLYGRDPISAEQAKDYFESTRVMTRPDMVLSLDTYYDKIFGFSKRPVKKHISRVLCILRNDKEGVLTEDLKRNIIDDLRISGLECELWDTDVKDCFPAKKKLGKIGEYLKFISGFDAVVTDRYHGMIFSVITRTPCVVLSTHNHKTTSAFDWFAKVNYLLKADSLSDVLHCIKRLESLDYYESPDWNSAHFDAMALEIKDFIGANA